METLNNTCCVCGSTLTDSTLISEYECEQCDYQTLNAYGHSRAQIIIKLREEIETKNKTIRKMGAIIGRHTKGKT